MAADEVGKVVFDPVEILNSEFGEDISLLDDVEKIKEKYEKKEAILHSSICESEKQTSDNLQNIMNSCDDMLQNIQECTLKMETIMQDYEFHDSNSKSMTTNLSKLSSEISQLENKEIYLKWKKEIDTLRKKVLHKTLTSNISQEIHQFLQQKAILNAVKSYVKLHDLCNHLDATSCEQLKTYFHSCCDRNYDTLHDLLSEQLESSLTSMKYPFPTGISSPVFSKDETEENFNKTILSLAKLKRLKYDLEPSESLVAILLTKPLKKRFYFHFHGERHTNNIEKPEWYFTQILNWIRDHNLFLDDHINKTLERDQITHSNIKGDFINILLSLCEEKLSSSLVQIRDNDVLLAHYIDEVLLFEKELQSINQEGHTHISCLHILLNEEFLKYWLDLERKFTLASMVEMLANENAWKSTFSELNTQEKKIVYFVPRCVEEFMTLLTLMTDRHKSLNKLDVQKRFLKVVVESISRFIEKVKTIASVQVINAESNEYCSILNGVFYIYHVLDEWSNDLYFIRLSNDGDEFRSDDDDENKSSFDDVMLNIDEFINGMVTSLTDFFETGLKPKVKLYRTERWHSLPCMKDYILPTLSPNACDMLLFIKQHLDILQENLCYEVFQKVWKQAAKTIDHLIFSEEKGTSQDVDVKNQVQKIAFECHFNEGGASQFQYDMKKNLFVIFGEHTARPETYFKLLSDSCLLLNLLPGSAVLLKEVLQKADKNYQTTVEEKENFIQNSLNDIGVKHLAYSQVNRIMKARVDWPKV